MVENIIATIVASSRLFENIVNDIIPGIATGSEPKVYIFFERNAGDSGDYFIYNILEVTIGGD